MLLKTTQAYGNSSGLYDSQNLDHFYSEDQLPFAFSHDHFFWV